jgi:hypothetical protein
MNTTMKAGRRGGWQPLIFSKRGKRLTRHSTAATGKAERPAFLGLPMASKIIERLPSGEYAAFTTDDLGDRTAHGSHADAPTALEAARVAYEAAANV